MKYIRTFNLLLIALIAVNTSSFSQANEIAASSDSTVITKVKVKGITCDMDLKMIAANVEKLNGVDKCETVKKGATTTFEIQFNPAHVTDKDIHAAIEGTGSCEDPSERPYKVKT